MTSRRHFLHTSLAGVITAPLFAQNSRLRPEGEFIRYGLVTYMWGADWDLPTLLENCEKAGIEGVELRIEHAHQVNLGLSPKERSAVRQRFEKGKVQNLGMGTNCEFHSTKAEEVKKQIALAKEYVHLSHDTGGSGIKVKPNNLPKEVSVEQTLKQIAASLAEIADYAVGFGQEIRLEVHGGVSDLSHIQTIMKTADCDNVRVCWNSNPDDLKGEGGLKANFAKVKDYLGSTTHIREVNQGDYPYAELAQLLVEADYTGWVLLEARTKPADRVAALIEQKKLFLDLVTKARTVA